VSTFDLLHVADAPRFPLEICIRIPEEVIFESVFAQLSGGIPHLHASLRYPRHGEGDPDRTYYVGLAGDRVGITLLFARVGQLGKASSVMFDSRICLAGTRVWHWKEAVRHPL